MGEGNPQEFVAAPDRLELDDGRDELNLAEFPLAAISDRVPDNLKTLVFEDQLFDAGQAKMITRRLTISASDKYGLPTSLDDEVILGLIQLTKQSRFADRKVSFSRYQLLQILGWRLEGRSYERLEKSLKRWLGVTLYYDKAWWDKDEQSWVDENFHILEQVTLYDQERRLKRLRNNTAEPPLSSFTWNEVVFRSFKSGYLKAIDLTVYRQLEYAAAKWDLYHCCVSEVRPLVRRTLSRIGRWTISPQGASSGHRRRLYERLKRQPPKRLATAD